MKNHCFAMTGVFSRKARAALWVGILSTAAMIGATQAQLADSYDLRSAGPGGVAWVAAVQNQSNLGDCWTFASSTALDSNLIMNGYLPTSTVAPGIAISSWHLSAYNGAIQNTLSDNSNYNGISGGDIWMATSYYTRGQGSWTIPTAPTGPNDISTMGGGPVLNSANALNPFPLAAVNNGDNLAPYLPPVSQTPAFTVTGAFYYDQPGSGRTAAEQVTVVKNAIQQFGAVTTYMYAGSYKESGHDESVFQYDETLGYEYTYNPTTKAADHAVTIIGWDDNVVIPTGNGTSTTGAWIVQNSWGAWGGTLAQNDGTFYASYDDPLIGQVGVTAFTAVPAGKYSPVVMQNEVGPTNQTGNSGANTPDQNHSDIPTGMGSVDSTRTTEAVTTLTASQTGQLIALGITSLDAQAGNPKTISISIYEDFVITDGQATPGTLLTTQDFVFQQAGYQAFDLNTPIDLTSGQALAVLVNYNGSDVPYVWQSAALGEAAPVGLTYFYDLTTGEWQDFGTFTGSGNNDDNTGIFSVKGLMAVPEPGTWALLALGLGAVFAAKSRRRA